jgi:hypothetical protein
MATADEIKQFVGKRVTLQLTPDAPRGPTVTGRILGVLSAADGLVVTLEPDGSPPGTRQTYHYHYIAAIRAAQDKS